MSLTILTNTQVSSILHSLTLEQIQEFQTTLAEALHTYSTEASENSLIHQPERTKITLNNGNTTLFMPSSNTETSGMKVVTLPAVKTKNDSSDSLTRTLADAQLNEPKPAKPLVGSLTLYDSTGSPMALLNAAEITAFRTALASTMLLMKRKTVHHLTVFGAGKQAYWHIRLALILRPGEIHRVNVINRSFERGSELLKKFYKEGSGPGGIGKMAEGVKFSILSREYGEFDRVLKEDIRSSDVIICTTPSTSPLFPKELLTDTGAKLKSRLLILVGSYKPHMMEVHPDILRQVVEPKKPRHLKHSPLHHYHHVSRHGHKGENEKESDSLKSASTQSSNTTHSGTRGSLDTDRSDSFSDSTSISSANSSSDESVPQSTTGGVIIVDSVSGCMTEAGEIIAARLKPTQLVEMGELMMLKKACIAEMQKEVQLGLEGQCKDREKGGGLREWLARGNIVYKSVGMGLMDLVVGDSLLQEAKSRGVGFTIDGF
jgi:ornithine cyclodeaminase/alanine dehydrogenase-like protein (mu-crystallin family)